jgi:hypothetical protein
MAGIADETLMAFADGELEPAERARVGKLLAADGEARERLEPFLGTREPLARVFDAVTDEPVPEYLRDAVLGSSPQSRRPTAIDAASLARQVSDLATSLRAVLLPPTVGWAPLALVLLAGMWVGWVLTRTTSTIETAGTTVDLLSGVTVAAGPLSRALESTPSGTPVSWQSAAGTTVSFKTDFSFLSKDRVYCRPYEMADAESARYAGLACRSGEGVWRIELQTRVPERAPASDRDVVPAQGGSTAVKAAVEGMIGGSLLVGAEEQAVINGGWSVRP